MLIPRLSAGGSWLLAAQIILICFGCQQPSPSKKGFAIDDAENVFFVSQRRKFIMYEHNKAKDTLVAKAKFDNVRGGNPFYNAQLDKIYSFCWDSRGGQIINIYDRPNGKPKLIAERKTASYSVFSYKDDYLIISCFFSPPQENKLIVGDTFYFPHDLSGKVYLYDLSSKAYLLETSEEDNRFTKEYDFYQTYGFVQDSLLYCDIPGDFISLNMETGGIKKIYKYNYFIHEFLIKEDSIEEANLFHFLSTPKTLTPPNQPLVIGKDLYMIPRNFVFLGASEVDMQVSDHLYNTYKINTLYKHLGNNTFEHVLEVPMSKDVEWLMGMGDHIFFIGQKNKDQTEVVRYNPASKEIKKLVLNKKGYFVYLAGKTKDYLVLLLRNPEAKRKKHILGLVPKDLKSNPKFYDLPDFDASNPCFFGISSKYSNNIGRMDVICNPDSRITRYDFGMMDSIMSRDKYYRNY